MLGPIWKDSYSIKKKIYKNGYIPWQPYFEMHGLNYKGKIVTDKNPLYGIVSDFYEIENDITGAIRIPVIPDGCSDMIFSYDGKSVKSYFCGSVKTIKELVFKDNKYLFGVRFMPGGTNYIFHFSNKELVENPLPLNLIIPFGRNLPEKIAYSQNFYERVSISSLFIIKHMLEQDGKLMLVQYCQNKMAENKGKVSINRLSEDTGYSTRYIGKVFEEYVGISPINLSDIIRLQYCLFLMFYEPTYKLSSVSAEAGYFDHSHMNRKFHKYLQTTSCGVINGGSFNNLLRGEDSIFFE